MLLSADEAKRSLCRLETIGRTSGSPREIEIWFAAEGDRVYLLSGGRDDAHWVRNLRADPRARLRFGKRWLTGAAHEIEGQPEEPRARQLLAAKYQGWRQGRPLSEWASESLPVAIDLAAPADGAG
jgi:deazaflavin-dependent oxidoreductase (nitroreductase family)